MPQTAIAIASLLLIGFGCTLETTPATPVIQESRDTREPNALQLIQAIELPDNFIVLDAQEYNYTESPIKFTGRVSQSTKKIIVTADYGDERDVYTLENYDAGDRSFQYQAAEKYNNLAKGINHYSFEAYFEDGSSETAEQSISYYPRSSSGSSIGSSLYNYSPGATYNSSEIKSPSCCKVCTTGKACGDSCISQSYTCHKGPGCACDGY